MRLDNLKPVALILGVSIVVFGSVWALGYTMGQRKAQSRAEQAENQATIEHGANLAYQAQALAKDQEIKAREAATLERDKDLAQTRARMDRANAELARLRSQLPIGPPQDQPVVVGDGDLASVVAQQDEVIQTQADVIKGQDAKIADLAILIGEYRVSRDLHQKRAESAEREAAGLRIALEAQKSLTKSALWVGRFQGLAVGIASGYVIGRMK